MTPDSDSAVLRAVKPSGGTTCFKVFLCNTEHCLTHVSEACAIRSDMGRSFFFQKMGHIMEILRSLLGFSLSSFCISFISLAALSKQLIWDGYRKLTTGEREIRQLRFVCISFLCLPNTCGKVSIDKCIQQCILHFCLVVYKLRGLQLSQLALLGIDGLRTRQLCSGHQSVGG